MKKLLLLAALVATTATVAQEVKFNLPAGEKPRRPKVEFTLPDSLAHMTPWSPDYRTMEPIRSEPTISMTSVVVIPREHLPARVTVINNNTLRLGRHFNISNGQAWNWSPYPDAYLDARTLSFPMPR